MLSLCLKYPSYFAHHGMLEEETLLGQYFDLEIVVHYGVSYVETNKVDYTLIHAIVSKNMEVSTAFLETIVENMANQLITQFDMFSKVQVTLSKTKVPIANSFFSASAICIKEKNK